MNPKLLKAFRTTLSNAYTRTSVVSSGKILGQGRIEVQKSVKNPQQDKTHSLQAYYTFQEEKLVQQQGHTLLNENVVTSAYSPDLSHQAVIRKLEGEHVYSLEVWKGDYIQYHKKLEKKHKAVCNIGAIVPQGIQWSQDGSRLLYCAERKDKEVDIWKAFDEPKEGEDKAKDPFKEDDLLSKFEYKHSWGEQSESFYNIELFILNLETETLGKVNGIPDHLKVISPQFLGREGTSLVFTGIDGTEYLPGLVFCYNKPSAIYSLRDFEVTNIFEKESDKKDGKDSQDQSPAQENQDKTQKISSDEKAIAYHPVPSPSGDQVSYFFSTEYNENHMFTTGLAITNLSNSSNTVLVEDSESDGKLAMYVTVGSKVFWDGEDSLIVQNSEEVASVLNKFEIGQPGSRTKCFFKTQFDGEYLSILDVTQDRQVLLSCTNFYGTRLGYISDFRACFAGDDETPYSGVVYEQGNYTTQSKLDLQDEQNQLYLFEEDSLFEKRISFKNSKGWLWGLKSFKNSAGEEVPTKDRPVIVSLHGGPHVASGASCFYSERILMNLGYLVMTLNYSGSWSYGKQHNECLAGNVGHLDVGEIMGVITQLQEDGVLTKTDVMFDGGSYSGLNGVALLQQNPHAFKAMMFWNPVVNLFHSLYSSDIAEWSYHESLGVGDKFKFSWDPTNEQLSKIKENSPGLQTFDNTSKTKILLILGDKDKRVVARAAYFLYRKWKEIGLDASCHVYPGGNHSIPKVEHRFDIEMNFFRLYAPGMEMSE